MPTPTSATATASETTRPESAATAVIDDNATAAAAAAAASHEHTQLYQQQVAQQQTSQQQQQQQQQPPPTSRNIDAATDPFGTPPATPTKAPSSSASYFSTPIGLAHLHAAAAATAAPRSLFGAAPMPGTPSSAAAFAQQQQYQQHHQQQSHQQQHFAAPMQYGQPPPTPTQQQQASSSSSGYYHGAGLQQQLPPPTMDFSATAAIMQLQSQMLTMAALNTPDRREREANGSSRDNAMLAYQLGERLGALGKTDEAVRETISRLQNELDRSRQATSEALNDLRAAEVEIEHQKEAQRLVQDALTKHNEAIDRLTSSAADVKKELAVRNMQQQQFEQAHSVERKSTLKSLDECLAKAASIEQRQALLEQERVRLNEDLKAANKLLAVVRNDMQELTSRIQLDAQAGANMRNQVRSELDSMKLAIVESATRARESTTALDARIVAQLAQQQQQLTALSSDVRAVHATTAPVNGFYSLLLALAMPFVSPERIVAVGGAAARALTSLGSATPSLRRFWSIALACDIAARLCALRVVRGAAPKPLVDAMTTTSRVVVAPLLAHQSAARALRVAAIVRLAFECIAAVRLALLLRQASLAAGHRASATLRRSFGGASPATTPSVVLQHDEQYIANLMSTATSSKSTAAAQQKTADDDNADDDDDDAASTSRRQRRRLSRLGVTAAAATVAASLTAAAAYVPSVRAMWPTAAAAATTKAFFWRAAATLPPAN